MANEPKPLTDEMIKNINHALEMRLEEANKDQTKIQWKNVLPDLMLAEVFVVAQVAPDTDAAGNKRLNIMMIKDNQGHELIPFFTSPAKMSAIVTPERKTFNVMKLTTVKLFQAIKGKPCILNMRSPSARIFNPFEMNVLVMENKDKLPKTKPAAPEATEEKPAE